MDSKERALITGLLGRVQALEFDEHHALSLLILLRRHAASKAPLAAELGDFVAHRERDRGLLLRFLKQVQGALLPGGQAPTHYDTPVSVPVLHDQLNALFAELSMSPIRFEHAECLALVVAALLDRVEFPVHGARRSRLLFGFNAQFAGLFGEVPLLSAIVAFPVMAVRNRFFESPFDDPETYWFPDRRFTVSAACHDGTVGFAQSPAL